MPALRIGIWTILNVIVVASGFSFKNAPKCIADRFPARLGSDLIIDCSTTDPKSTSTLYHNNRAIHSTNSSVYSIHITLNTSGAYKCVAANQSGHLITWKCKILPYRSSQLEAPVIDSRTVYRAGYSFNLTCRVKNNANIKLEFYKSDTGSRDLNQPNVIHSVKSVTLQFTNPLVMPETKYTCVIRSGMLTRKADTYISVKVPPEIDDSSKEVVALGNKLKNLTCKTVKTKGQIDATFNWLQNPCTSLKDCKATDKWQPISADHNQRPPTDDPTFTSTITVPTSVRSSMSYKCIATSILGSDSHVITFHRSLPPEIDDSSKEVVALGNKLKNLTCKTVKTKGQIPPTFKWLQNPCLSQKDCKATDKWKPISAYENQRPPPDDPTFTSTITVPTSVRSSMSYKCIATSILGSDSHVITFHRSRVDKPKVEIKGVDTLNAEETLHFSCVVSVGYFARWRKNGRKILPSRDPRVSIKKTMAVDINGEMVTLTILNATVNDSGRYECIGKNVLNELTTIRDTKMVTVKALFKPSITSLSNITVNHYFNNETNIELTCNVTSNPKPRITWSKEGSSLPPLKAKESCENMVSGYYLKKTSQGTGNVLLICDADNRHTGWYTCYAENNKGYDAKNGYVNILTEPKIMTESSYKIMYRTIGQSVDINCKAKGNPTPTVTWTKLAPNGSTITWRENGKSFSSVHIAKLQKDSSGNYTCVATNSRGRDKMVINVKAQAEPSKRTGSDSQTIVLASGIGGAIGFLFIIGVLACCLVNRRQKRLLEEYKALKYLRNGEDYKLDPNRTILEQCEDLPYDADWEFPVKRLILQGVIGSGSFGQVMKAEAIGILSFTARDKTSEAFKRRSRLRRRLSSSRIYQDSTGSDYNTTTVAVKMLKAEANESDYKDLATELKIMIHLGEHNNIINLLGACTKTKQLMVIMEFAPHGNLLNFLRSRREIYEATWRKTANKPDTEFTLADLVMYSYQIARGMDFLSSKKCVHRDLAARNILIGEDYVMKIADFGLARDIYKSDLYVKETTGLLPVKWMAPESLFDRVYTQKTDVWSFGVVLWETQTLGGTPYPGVPVEELMDYLSEGKRMRQPTDCPPEMYAIMRDCWLQKPSERPTFSELVRRIERIIEKKISGQESGDAYISVFMDEDLHRIYYLEPKDTFKDSSVANSPRSDGLQSMTEEEIQASPLPSVPCLSLQNIFESPQDEDDPAYCDPVDNDHDTRYVQSPLSPVGSPNRKTRGNIFNYQNLPPSPKRSLPREIDDHEKRMSECSTEVESGIEMDESYANDHSLGRRKYYYGLTEPVDAEPGMSLLDSSVVKDKTKETIL